MNQHFSDSYDNQHQPVSSEETDSHENMLSSSTQPTSNDTLREAVETWLTHLNQEEGAPADIVHQEISSSPPDLYSLVEVITALRQEISLQGRSFHQLEKTIASHLEGEGSPSGSVSYKDQLVQSMKEIQSGLHTFFSQTIQETYDQGKQQGKEEILQILLDPLLDTHDQLRRLINQNTQKPKKSIWRLFTSSSSRKVLEHIKTLELVYEKINQRLGSIGVTPAARIGRPFDPASMKAADTTVTDEFDENTVIEIYRQGYIYEDKVLRFAEVCVTFLP